MKTALLTPFVEGEAEKAGAKRFRKQLLPVGSLEYEGETLDFSKPKLEELARNFKDSGEQVPFVLADGENRHTSDPERFRGEVVDLSVEDDGLYAVVEASEKGAELIADNPKLGISARIVRDGKDLIEHVCGTLVPRVKGMKPWKAVALSDDQKGVVARDLTGVSFSAPAMDGLSPEDVKTLKALAEKVPALKALADNLDDDGQIKLSDEDKAALDALLAPGGDDPQHKGEKPELSDEAKAEIQAAKDEAKAATERAARVESEAADERFEREAEELVGAGVPPADVKLAEPLLRRKQVIELTDGDDIDASAIVRKLLESRKGTVDLTEVTVGGDAPEDSEQAKARETAKAWREAA